MGEILATICVPAALFVLFVLLERALDGEPSKFDEHFVPRPPPPLTPVPRALLCKPANDDRAPYDAPTAPAARKRTARAA